MKVRLAPFAPEHIDAVMAIERLSNPSPWSVESFRSELANPQSVFLVALSGSEAVGFGGIWLVVDEAHVTTLAVHPDYRRSGVGRLLMNELLSRAKQAGMTCSTLEVRSQNEPAIELYESLGYRRTATRKRYYPNNDDATVMWLEDLDIPQVEPTSGKRKRA